MAENEKNFLIVDTDEAGQVIGMRRMESGDTISNDRLNTDIRDAGSNATLALETANNAQLSATAAQDTANDVAASTVNLSGYISENQGAWGAGGIDPTDLANLKDASNAIAGFSGTSGTFASSNKGAGVIVDADIASDAALSGGKIATGTITNTQIATNTITTDELAEGAALANIGPGGIPSTALSAGAAVANIGADGITSNELGPSAVTAAKINANAITADKIVDGTITTTELNTNAGITNAQLAGNIALGKLATTTPNGIIGTGSDSQPAMISASVARDNMGLSGLAIRDTVGSTEIETNAVTTNELGPSAVAAGNITQNAVTTDKINGQAVTTNKLGLQAVTAARIANDTITATQIADNTLSAAQIAAGTITGTEIADDAINTNHIVDDAIQTAQIKNGKVTNDKLAGEIPQHKLASSGVSKIFVTTGSGVAMSGSEGADAAPAPNNGAVLVIDTAAARLKFTDTISGAKIDDGTIDDTKLAAGAAQGNIGLNSITFAQLPLMNAESFVGNSASIGGNMGQFTAATAKTMLDIGGSYSVGTTAPTSPTGGDIWYNTTTDVDELFAYDSGRGKWLGVNSFCINAGRTGTIGSDVGHYAIMDNREMNTAVGTKRGFQVPFDCTVVGWAWSAGTDTSGFMHRLAKYDDSAGTSTANIHTYSPAGVYDNWEQLNLDIDYDQRDIIGYSAIVASSPTGTIVNQNLTIVIKRRTS